MPDHKLDHKEIYREELQDRTCEYEQMEDRVHELYLFEDIEHCAHRVAKAAG